ncbi:MAG: cation:proton antiporter, partial [Myxococcales bacterium]|nr:cation:proton antiporter [Myxococcales bacterium]
MIPILLLLALGGLMHAAGTFAASSATLAGPELAFGFLLLTAYFAGSLVARMSMPRLTGYIIAGIVVGPFALRLVEQQQTGELRMVGDVATAIIALTGGAELELKSIRPLFKSIRAMTFYAVIGSMVVVAGTLLVIRPLIPFLDALPLTQAAAVSGALGVAFAAQSPAVVMALIGETRAAGVLTQTILSVVVIADLVVVVLYGIASAAATAVVSGQADLARTIGGIAWEILGSIGIGIFVGIAIERFLLYVNRGVGLFAVMVCFVVAEVGAAVHLDPLVIMLTAGIYLQNFSKADAHHLIDGFDAASLPVYLVFFALAGAKLDLGVVRQLALPVALVATARAAAFWAGSKVAARRAGASPAVARYAWLGLVPQAGLALALAELMRRTFH